MRTGPYKLLRDFAQKHPNTRSALEHWYRLIRGRNFRSITELREIFPHADRVEGWTVFNIGGNKARLIVIPFLKVYITLT
ncbi:type II toxin-antitoxin system HigB family toxin [Candidatus Poribacteria bacterium]|nr:type II toxin-antitoxin system HigB family toxin [Candidatus Poribacteria bacterium]MYH79482.1 type II toxin-antitoxin system HigB family toxin [Candidatus Poribacteria bacterium]